MRISVLAALVCAGAPAMVASAQFNSRQVSQYGAGTGVEGAATYQVDDGTSENGVGLINGGELAWMNAFQVTGGNNVITSIDLTWGTPQAPNGTGLSGGESFMVYVWEGTPTGAHTLLASAMGNVSAGSIDTDIFQSVAINAVIGGGDGASYFIGASINHSAGTFPASIDQSSSLGQSFVSGSGTQGGFNPNNLADAVNIGVFEVGSVNLPGNWMLRANAVPTPGALSLFGVAGLAAARRRR